MASNLQCSHKWANIRRKPPRRRAVVIHDLFQVVSPRGLSASERGVGDGCMLTRMCISRNNLQCLRPRGWRDLVQRKQQSQKETRDDKAHLSAVVLGMQIGICCHPKMGTLPLPVGSKQARFKRPRVDTNSPPLC